MYFGTPCIKYATVIATKVTKATKNIKLSDKLKTTTRAFAKVMKMRSHRGSRRQLHTCTVRACPVLYRYIVPVVPVRVSYFSGRSHLNGIINVQIAYGVLCTMFFHYIVQLELKLNTIIGLHTHHMLRPDHIFGHN